MGILALGVALGTSGLFAMLALKAHTAMTSLRTNLAMEAFFDPSISSDDASIIADHSLKPIVGITRFEFISKEQALRDYAKMSGEDIESVLGMNPLPASVKVYLANPTAKSYSTIEALLSAIPEVREVRGDLPLLSAMETRSHSLDTLAIIFGSLMLLSAFFYSLLTSRHGFDTRRETLHTLDLLGASRTSAVAPIIISSSLAGAFGGIVGTLLLYVIHAQVLMAMSNAIPLSISGDEYLLALGLLTCVGFLIGSLGAVFSANFSLRKPSAAN
jgi:cell division transport system permease protein